MEEIGPGVTSSLLTARNYTGDEGRFFEFDNQVLISKTNRIVTPFGQKVTLLCL